MIAVIARAGAQPNKSLIDGIATLQALATSAEPVGGRELARRLNLEPTRVNRLLKTLAYLGIARQTSGRKYTAGPGMHVLAAQSLFASGLVNRALAPLAKLRRFGHTVAMGVLWRDTVSYLYHAPPNVPENEALGRIGLYPASSGGIGIVLLAELEDEQIRGLYKDKAIPNYPGGLPVLMKEIRRTRARGYARVRPHLDQDYHTIAILAGSPSHSAIAVYGWIPPAATETIVQALKEAASEIENERMNSEEGSPAQGNRIISGLNAI